MAIKKSTRKAINYAKLAQMWEQGKSYEQMGQALGMKGNGKDDPWKPVRAAVSNMLRGKATAWKDGNSKVRTLKPRDGMRAIGVGKKVKKSTKPVKKALLKKAVKKSVPQVDGKTLTAGGGK